MSSHTQMELSLSDKETEESTVDRFSTSRSGINESAIEPIILTPNASLAQQLRRQRLLARDGHSSAAAPIHILQRWIGDKVMAERRPEQASYSFASDAQLRYLWEQLISEQRDSNQELQQLNPGYLAGQALSAWKSLKHWKICADELARAETGQLLSLGKWVKAFEKRLNRLKLTTVELEAIKQLSEPSDAKSNGKMPRAQIYAFIDPPAPLWAEWLALKFDTVESLSYMPAKTRADIANNQQFLIPLDSRDHELEAAMLWGKSIFESDAQARIAIIDVDLKDNLKAIKRRAEAAFADIKGNIRFSRDTPLLSIGCVQTALKLLALNKKQVDLATARFIVHSPLWSLKETAQDSYQTEYIERSQWDISLCALQRDEVHTSDFMSLLKELHSGSSKLASIFSDRHRNKQLSPLQWCDLFQRQLQQLNCFEHFSDNEWQRWVDVLADFAKLGAVCGSIGIAEALQQLDYYCTASTPKISSSAPGISFMDTVEAAADYTHIWVMGMDNMSWPGATRLNPLLPVSLQIQKQMPHSQPQLETELTRRLIERLALAAPQVVFSYSQFHDELEQSPCSFVADLPLLTPSFAAERKPESEPLHRAAAQTPFEWVDCSSAPSVPKQQREVRGGAGLLKAMASSPFDAFAQWRLGAYELDSPKVGLSALDRGNLVHNVLERVWNELGGSKALAKLDSEQVADICRHAASKELRRFQAKNGWLAQSFANLEAERLASLTSDWLSVERSRPEFSVEFIEERLIADIAGLRFKMRLDRLDRLADGRLMLIDYKTGQSLSRRFWLDMPPAEPQLPLYALTLGSLASAHQPDALCFAKVRADKMEFIGIGSDEFEGLTGIQPQDNWAELIEGWKESLEALATDFINGDTRAFETAAGYGRSDPFAPLHRFAEYEQLETLRTKSGGNS